MATGSRSSSSVDVAGPPVDAARPVDLITYSYASRMVFVALPDTYDKALDLAQESFPELRDVDRDLICLETRTWHRKAQIGRTAWPAFLAMFARFEVLEVYVLPPPQANSIITRPPSYTSREVRRADETEDGRGSSLVSPASQLGTSYSRPRPRPPPPPRSLLSRTVGELFRT